MIHVNDKFYVEANVRKAMAEAMIDGDKCRYVTKSENGQLALRFNGFLVTDTTVELLLDGRPVAKMHIPRRCPGDTLTIEGRGSMFGQYVMEIL